MITVSYNVISLNEVRKISNNNKNLYDPPIIIGQIIVHSRNKMAEILLSNIERNNIDFVISVLCELKDGDVSGDIVEKAIKKLEELGKLETAGLISNKYNYNVEKIKTGNISLANMPKDMDTIVPSI